MSKPNSAVCIGFLLIALLAVGPKLQAQTWKRIGTDYEPTKGVTYCLVTHPQRAGVLLAGVRPGGLLLSEDGGNTWLHTSKPFDKAGNYGPNHSSLCRAPSQPDTVYAALEKLGIWCSRDNCKTWETIAGTLPKGRAHNGISVAVHPTDPKTVWLGTDGGIFKTTDGGNKWLRLAKGLPTGKTAIRNDKYVSQTIMDIIVDTKNPNLLWFAMYATGYNQPAGVWRSEDGGESWNHSSDGIDTGERMVEKMKHKRDWVMRIVRSQSNPDVFFIATTTAIYLSKDGAKTWEKLPYDKQVAAVAIAPHNEDHLFIGMKDGFVKQSVDGGQNWSDFSKGLPTGPVPGARIIKFTFMGDDGKMINMESTSRRESNMIESFAFDTTDPSVLYVSAASGLYRVEPFD